MSPLNSQLIRQKLKRRIFAVRDIVTRLRVLKQAGFHCSGAIDGGAYQGSWTKDFWTVFPEAPVLMIEPQPAPQALLYRLAKTVPGSDVLEAAISDKAGTSRFAIQDSNSGIRNTLSSQDCSIQVNCTTLRNVLNERPEFKPNLLKLDLQGQELQALRGAASSLQAFEVVICEMSIIPIGGVPAFNEVNHFFESNGYRLYDIIPQYDRPLDGALWQIDAFYARNNSPLISSASWN